jgi:hypothetical protein
VTAAPGGAAAPSYGGRCAGSAGPYRLILHMTALSAVLIGAPELLPALRVRAGADSDVVTFSDNHPLEALQLITKMRPPLVVLERLFAATPRGAALINRLKGDPALTNLEIRVLSHTGDYRRTVHRPTVVEASVGAAGSGGAIEGTTAAHDPSLDWHGTRRAPRVRIREGFEVHVDGNAAALVDLSAVGAQVLSGAVLRPNQNVRMLLPDEGEIVRVRALVAWAKFELPRAAGGVPRYRAGMDFRDAEAAILDALCGRNRKD